MVMVDFSYGQYLVGCFRKHSFHFLFYSMLIIKHDVDFSQLFNDNRYLDVHSNKSLGCNFNYYYYSFHLFNTFEKMLPKD
ncbi:hypothetical protein T10_9132 [Trichinella papuae]|uniref:Uncharacterized protein n=1 Tax=Trichinella papuae TaxID=268474 RepID=A0A0V1N8Z3_9BILA|nr:hypothetical protein T10_9132 [Trichinella papuae]